MASSKEQQLSDQLQNIRKVLVELQIHLADSEPSERVLQDMQSCVTSASDHAAKAKELSELIKVIASSPMEKPANIYCLV